MLYRLHWMPAHFITFCYHAECREGAWLMSTSDRRLDSLSFFICIWLVNCTIRKRQCQLVLPGRHRRHLTSISSIYPIYLSSSLSTFARWSSHRLFFLLPQFRSKITHETQLLVLLFTLIYLSSVWQWQCEDETHRPHSRRSFQSSFFRSSRWKKKSIRICHGKI